MIKNTYQTLRHTGESQVAEESEDTKTARETEVRGGNIKRG